MLRRMACSIIATDCFFVEVPTHIVPSAKRRPLTQFAKPSSAGSGGKITGHELWILCHDVIADCTFGTTETSLAERAVEAI